MHNLKLNEINTNMNDDYNKWINEMQCKQSKVNTRKYIK